MHPITVYTGGELHDWPADTPTADFVCNLVRLLDDPAHRPEGDMLDMRGDRDQAVKEFVFSTRGARELLEDWVVLLMGQARFTPVVVHVLCRGGKHRAAAFGQRMHDDLLGFGHKVTVQHLHVHLPR